jgi:hypothetical protein
MDKPCRNSWIGAHEIFQAREYDAGASPTSSEPTWKQGQLDKHHQIFFEKHFGIVVQT